MSGSIPPDRTAPDQPEPGRFGAELGIRLKHARQQAGLGQDVAAARCGLARTDLASWESGRVDATAEGVAKLARLYGVCAHWLLGLADNMTPLGPNRLLVSEHALDCAARLADSRIPFPEWPSWLVRQPGLEIAYRCPSGARIVSADEEAEYLAALDRITKSILSGRKASKP